MILQPRVLGCIDANGNTFDCNTTWHGWARWVVAACLVVGFFAFLVAFAIITSRRRRRRGVQPYYGTAWLAPGQGGYGPQQYGQTSGYPSGQYPPGQYPPGQYPPGQTPNTAPYYGQPAPPYSPAPDFQQQPTYGQAGGYFPPQGPPQTKSNDYEMQPHQQMYSPPAGPPPGSPSVQSNNPYFVPPANPLPAHTNMHGAAKQ